MRASTPRGFTLVELLVALGILSILLASVFQIFINVNYAFTAQDQAADLQQNLRFSLDRIAGIVRAAGFCSARETPPVLVATNKSTAEGVLANSDMLKLRYSPGPSTFLTTEAKANDTVLKVADSMEFRLNDKVNILGLSDGRLQLFTGPKSVVAAPSAATDLSVEAITAEAPKGALVCVAPKDVTIYVTADGVLELDADGVLTNHDAAAGDQALSPRKVVGEDVVGNVEDLQFRFFLDTDTFPDGQANSEVPASGISSAQLGRVLAIEIGILMRSAGEDPRFTNNLSFSLGDNAKTQIDHYQRRALVTTVRLRNNVLGN